MVLPKQWVDVFIGETKTAVWTTLVHRRDQSQNYRQQHTRHLPLHFLAHITVGMTAFSASPASAMTLRVTSAVLTMITPTAPALCAARVFMLKEQPPLSTATNIPAARTCVRPGRKRA